MKSLKESLFDSEKNITKDMTFGDFFKLDLDKCSDPDYWPFDKQFSAQRIKKKTGVSGEDKCKLIFNGFIKIIQNIDIDKGPEELTKEWLFCKVEKECWDMFQYSMKVKNIYITLFRNGHLILTKDESVLDADTVQIMLGPNLQLEFKRK